MLQAAGPLTFFSPSKTYFWNGLKSSLPPSRTYSGFISVIKDTAITKDCLVTSERQTRGFRPVCNTPIHSPLAISAESPRGPVTSDWGTRSSPLPPSLGFLWALRPQRTTIFVSLHVSSLSSLQKEALAHPFDTWKHNPQVMLSQLKVWRSWLPTESRIYYRIRIIFANNLKIWQLFILSDCIWELRMCKRRIQKRKINLKLWRDNYSLSFYLNQSLSLTTPVLTVYCILQSLVSNTFQLCNWPR